MSNATPDTQLIKATQVAKILGIHRVRIYHLLKEPGSTFPKQIRIGERSVRWRKADVLDWIERKAASQGLPSASDAGGAK